MSFRKKIFLFFLIFSLWVFSSKVFAVNDIQIENVSVDSTSQGHYLLKATVINAFPEASEVVLRAQIVFYDKSAPKGDLPVMILRKDMTLVLKQGENREAQFQLLNEGTYPPGSLRMEYQCRVRRQREWKY